MTVVDDNGGRQHGEGWEQLLRDGGDNGVAMMAVVADDDRDGGQSQQRWRMTAVGNYCGG
jgi:hypothetical protein